MLTALSIENIVLIEKLSLEFETGLNVLTGETGAGKSILLDALGFALGARARGELLRAGASSGSVTAEFWVPQDHGAHDVLAELGLGDDREEPILLRRTITADGRRGAFVNDKRASTEALRSIAASLLEVHGQQDDRGLLDPKGHIALLDAFAGHDALLLEVRTGWSKLREARAALDAAKEAQANAARDEEFLRHAVEELRALDPQPGEDDALDLARRQMQAAARLRSDVLKASEALGSGVEAQLSDASRWLEDVSAKDDGTLETEIAPVLAAMSRAFAEVAEASAGVEALLERLIDDPAALERTEERLFALRALARKHHIQPEALPGLAEDFSNRLEAIDGGAGQIADLEKAVEAAERTYNAAAETLSKSRISAATRLEAAMTEELPPLKMERAVFKVEMTSSSPGTTGTDAVVFTISTNPGTPPGPLNKVASGGELSRFLLALKVCLTTRAEGLTMIFDEIDRGVGGATADAVGRRLARLSTQSQVLVVTHSPQVAAQGAHHWHIRKRVEGDGTRTEVLPLSPDERVDEVARMLSGDRLTDEARAAAKTLLEG
ncbi:MAG: DNA repair protein RecN [Pseudomonadota bacterium]